MAATAEGSLLSPPPWGEPSPLWGGDSATSFFMVHSKTMITTFLSFSLFSSTWRAKCTLLLVPASLFPSHFVLLSWIFFLEKSRHRTLKKPLKFYWEVHCCDISLIWRKCQRILQRDAAIFYSPSKKKSYSWKIAFVLHNWWCTLSVMGLLTCPMYNSTDLHNILLLPVV